MSVLDFRALVEAGPDIVAIFDREHRYVYVNGALERATGVAASSVLGRRNDEVMPPDQAAMWREALDAVLATRGERTVECTIDTPRGRRRFASLLTLTAEGQVCAVTRDVTELQEARVVGNAVLAEAGDLLARLSGETDLQGIADLVVPRLADWCVIHLRDGELVHGVALTHADPEKLAAAHRVAPRPHGTRPGPGLARVLAGGGAMLIGPITPDQIGTYTHSDDQTAFIRTLGFRAGIIAPLAARDGVLGAITFVSADSGRVYDERDLALLSELARRTALALENVRLLAAEKRAREDARRLQALTGRLSGALDKREIAKIMVSIGRETLGAAASFAWLLRDDGDSLDLAATDDGFETPVAPFRTLSLATSGMPLCAAVQRGEALYFESHAALLEAFPGSLPSSAYRAWAVMPFVVRGRGAGGVSFSFSEARAFSAEDRALLGAMSSQASIALERAMLFEAVEAGKLHMQRAYEAAYAAGRRKDEFLAMLGHELRNPLAPITMALDLMRLRNDDAHRREREVIARQIAHLTRLIDDLLDVSRVTRGKVQLTKQVVETEVVVRRALEIVMPLIEKRAHRLVVDVPDRGLLVEADPTRLAQVLQNLLANAAKYTEPGGEIRVRARTEEDRVVIDIADTGIGVAPELLPRLFDLFVQGDRALDRSEGGLGIGLTIARMLTDLHGGKLEAASDGPGRGSTFTVRLPRATQVQASEPRRAPEQRASTRMRVLLVDDNVDAAAMLHDLLARLGHELVVAHDGPRALELMRDFRPDVAVLDIGLPEIDGYELARRIRADPDLAQLRLIAVTGYGQDADKARAREAGFDHHLVKPIELDELTSLLSD